MAYRRKTARRVTTKRAPARRTYAAPARRRAPARRAAPARRSAPQTVRIELVQAPQPISSNPIADALAAAKKPIAAPKKAKF